MCICVFMDEYMLTVSAAGKIMCVLVCVFLCTRHMLTAIPARQSMHVLVCMFFACSLELL